MEGAKDMFDISCNGSRGRLSVLVAVMCVDVNVRLLNWSVTKALSCVSELSFTCPEAMP